MKKIIKLILICLITLNFTGCSSQNVPEHTYIKKTLSYYLINEFHDYVSINKDVKVEELSKHLIQIERIEFKGSAKEIDEGYLDGIINYKVTDFKNGAMIKANKTKIPFIGYLFEVDQSTDTQLFIENLKTNADKQYKTLLDDEDIYIEKENNIIFFLICPDNIEEFY